MKSAIQAKGEGLRGATTYTDIEIPPFNSLGTVCLDRVSAINVDHSPTLVTIGYKVGASEFLVEGYSQPASGQVVSTQSRIFISGQARVFARFTGGTQGDKLQVYAYGYVDPQA